MNKKFYGALINKDGHGRYTQFNDTETVIRYIFRENGQSNADLIAKGGRGILEYGNAESAINQFRLVHERHTRRGNFGRYLSHEIFSFSNEGEAVISAYNLDIDTIARQMTENFFEKDHCQAVYGVHAPDRDDSHLHIHFAVNAVCYDTGNKRRENMRQTKEREEHFQKIIADEIAGAPI